MPSSSPDVSARVLTSHDVGAAVNLSNLAGWNQTEADWKLLLELEPEGCLGIESDGQIIATATIACYGDRLAWLGMVLTHPQYRRRGFARRLLESALNIAAGRGVRSIKLDATEQGAPLYRSLGFETEQEIQRWSGDHQPALAAVSGGRRTISNTRRTGGNFALDRQAFGADRSRLLCLLADNGHAFANGNGFALARPGSRAWFLGPCVARTPEAARALIELCLATHAGAWFWDLLPVNREAAWVATDLGFHPERKLLRMVKGQEVRGDEQMTYAGAGFEFG